MVVYGVNEENGFGLNSVLIMYCSENNLMSLLRTAGGLSEDLVLAGQRGTFQIYYFCRIHLAAQFIHPVIPRMPLYTYKILELNQWQQCHSISICSKSILYLVDIIIHHCDWRPWKYWRGWGKTLSMLLTKLIFSLNNYLCPHQRGFHSGLCIFLLHF